MEKISDFEFVPDLGLGADPQKSASPRWMGHICPKIERGRRRHEPWYGPTGTIASLDEAYDLNHGQRMLFLIACER